MCKNGKAFTIIGAVVLAVSLFLNTFYFADIYSTLGKVKHEMMHYGYYIEKQTDTINFGSLIRANIYIQIKKSCGSGTVVRIDKDYIYILTARHVVEANNKIADVEIEVPTDDGIVMAKVKDGDIIVSDDWDLALVRIDYIEKHQLIILSPAKRLCYIGDTVYVVGNPLGFRDVITKGIFSTYHSNLKSPMGISCGVIFGTSGGAVVNANGELVGVVSQVCSLGAYPITYLGAAVPQKPTRDFISEAFEKFEKETTVTKSN